jgi:hypothetical protein
MFFLMSKKGLLLFLVSFLVAGYSKAQENEKEIYSGGMLMFQPALVKTSNIHTDIETLNMGIGGILRFYPVKYLTAGIYGGTMKGSYSTSGSENSFISLSYGGIVAGFSHKIKNVRLSLCLFGGRGSIKNLHIETQTGSQLNQSWLYKTSTFVYAPLLSADFTLTNRIVFTSQITYFHADGRNYRAPALQLGLLFRR